ncbi:MAG: exosortase system-associated protein, TIGR04073 family [Candidatus Omnitrophica bacterium]|nr:exosortase system-associated protein, TIGR04073 family [Candidatus Omnitrophota bacterium]
MAKKMQRRFSWWTGILCASFLFSSPVSAQNYQTHWFEESAVHPSSPWDKAGRGFANLSLGWTEIVYQPFLAAEDGQRWPAAFGAGLIKGICRTVVRASAGVYELASFPIEYPKDYKPLLLPEVPFPRDKIQQRF